MKTNIKIGVVTLVILTIISGLYLLNVIHSLESMAPYGYIRF